MTTIGQTAIKLVLLSGQQEDAPFREALRQGYKVAIGRVGTMELEKIVAAIETAAKRENIIEKNYRHEHALYHAAVEALHGVCRGQLNLGNILRTVGLNFAVVRGLRNENCDDGEWIAVALYGTIGAPVKGWEHETIGLGINHL